MTWHGEIVAERLQSKFSPTGDCTKLAANAFAFCSLETLCGKKLLRKPSKFQDQIIASTLVATLLRQKNNLDTSTQILNDRIVAKVNSFFYQREIKKKKYNKK